MMCVCVGARGLKPRLLTAQRNPRRYRYPKKKWSHHGKNDERTHQNIQNSDEVAQVPFSKIFTLRLVSVPRVLVNQGGLWYGLMAPQMARGNHGRPGKTQVT